MYKRQVYEVKQNLFAPPREQELALRLRTRLQTKLALTPEQVAQVNPIIDKAVAQLRSIRLDTIQQVNKVFEDTYAQISAILTPDQRAKLAIICLLYTSLDGAADLDAIEEFLAFLSALLLDELAA